MLPGMGMGGMPEQPKAAAVASGVTNCLLVAVIDVCGCVRLFLLLMT
jgi:hypothetical protein